MDREIQLRIETAVENAQSARSLKDIKASMKELKELGIEFQETNKEAFDQVGKAAGELRDRIDDAKESMATFTGDSIEQVRNSVKLLGEGLLTLDFGKATEGARRLTKALQDFDFKKIKDQFKDFQKAIADAEVALRDKFGNKVGDTIKGVAGLVGNLGAVATKALSGDFVGAIGSLGNAFQSLGAIIKANPILAIAAVVIFLATKIDELSEAGGLLGQIFTKIGEAVKFVSDLFTKFIDLIFQSNKAGQAKADETVKSSKKEEEAIAKRYDREIAIAEAAGKDTFRLQEEKTRKLQEENNKQVQTLQDLARVDGKLNDDRQKDLDGLLEKQKDYTAQYIALKEKERLANKAAFDNARSNTLDLVIDNMADGLQKRLAEASNNISKQRNTLEEEILKQEKKGTKESLLIAKELAFQRTELDKKEANDRLKVQTNYYKEQADKAEQAQAKLTAAQERRRAKEKKDAEDEIKDIQGRYKELAEAEGVFTAARRDQQNLLLDEQADAVVRLQKQLQLSAGQVKGLLADIEKTQRDNNGKLEKQNQEDIKAVDRVAILRTKSLKDETDAKIKLIQDTAAFELRDVQKSEDQKLLIREQALKDIQELQKQYAFQQDENTIDTANGKVEASTAVAENDPTLQNKLRVIELEQEAREKALEIQYKRELENAERTGQDIQAINEKYDTLRKESDTKTNQSIQQERLAHAALMLQIAQAFVGSLNALNDLISQNEIDGLKKGEKVSLETQRRQFVRTKALSITQAAISTALAVISALADPVIPYPAKAALAIAAGITGAIQIAAIASKKFNPDGGDSGGGSPQRGVLPGSTGSGTTPTPSAATMFNLGQGGTSNIFGGKSQRVEVLESDITNTQRGIAVIQAGALLR